MNPAECSLALARLLEETHISLLSLTEGEQTVTLRRQISPAIPLTTPDAALTVAAPCPGVFLRAHPLRAERLAEAGCVVEAGAPLGLLRIGPLLIEVQAPAVGTLSTVEASDGALVGFGTALFRLSPEGNAA